MVFNYKYDYSPCYRNCNKNERSFKINYTSHNYTQFDIVDVENSTCSAIS
jgi:hypothetical protein